MAMMHSVIVKVNNRNPELSRVFQQVQQCADQAGLSHKQALGLRLLAEETMSLLRSITGQLDADFWLDWEGKSFCLHLCTKQKLGNVQRRQLIGSTTDRRNAAVTTFLDRLREFYEKAMSVRTDMDHYYAITGTSLAAHASDESIRSEQWDEYERSVLLAFADHVSIGIRDGFVDMRIRKSFT